MKDLVQRPGYPGRSARGACPLNTRTTQEWVGMIELMRSGAVALVGLLITGLGAAGSPAAAMKDPRPPTAHVSKGTYFSTRYKTRFNVRRSGWDVKRIVVRGKGFHRVIRGTRRSLMLAPGAYRVAVDYVEEPDPPPSNWESLWDLDFEGAMFTLMGGEQVVSTISVRRWDWDPMADPNKGYDYKGSYESEANVVKWATRVGAVLDGRLACLTTRYGVDPSQLVYYYDDDSLRYVLVARDDPRIYAPPEQTHWFDYNRDSVPEEPGKVQWQLYYTDPSGGRCDFAFRAGQVPMDYDWNTVLNRTPWIARLPDGNWRLHEEQVPWTKRWVGTVTAVLPDGGVTYESQVESLERWSGQSPDLGNWRPPTDPEFPYTFPAAAKLRLKRETLPTPPALKSTTVASQFKVRAVNSRWVSRGEAKAIKMGMSKDRVFQIIGSKGSLEVRASGVEVRQWGGWDLLTIGFRNGRVASIVY